MTKDNRSLGSRIGDIAEDIADAVSLVGRIFDEVSGLVDKGKKPEQLKIAADERADEIRAGRASRKSAPQIEGKAVKKNGSEE